MNFNLNGYGREVTDKSVYTGFWTNGSKNGYGEKKDMSSGLIESGCWDMDMFLGA